MTTGTLSRVCSNTYDDRDWRKPFGGLTKCGRQMESVITASGVFWRCSHCDPVYQRPNKRVS